MFNVKLFEEKTIIVLQDVVNEWLSAHKDVAVQHSNLSTTVDAYTFYILYTTTEAKIEELKEIAAEVKPEFSVEATDINPEVLKPTS
ncbi:MAG: hypothetical protein QM802_19575 [Agriterribacter sp.]